MLLQVDGVLVQDDAFVPPLPRGPRCKSSMIPGGTGLLRSSEIVGRFSAVLREGIDRVLQVVAYVGGAAR